MSGERSSPVRIPDRPPTGYSYPSPSPTPSPNGSPVLLSAALPPTSSIAFPTSPSPLLTEPAPHQKASSSLPSSLFPLSPHFVLNSRTPSPPSRHSAGPSPAFHHDDADAHDEDPLSPAQRVGYSSLPPSPTRSFVSLGGSPKSAPTPDALDLDLLRQRFESPEPDDGYDKEHEQTPTPPQEPEKRSLWEHLQEEIWANDFESGQDLKWERVSNFLQVPLAIEKIIGFGSLVCLDSFLYIFTILPIRSLLAFCALGSTYLSPLLGRGARRRIAPTQKVDIIKFLLLFFSCTILVYGTDASYIYHAIRGQDSIKLVVIYGAFEIADKLCCAFSQDVLDSLFARETISRRANGSQPHIRPLFFFFLSLVCVLAHTLVFFFQLISLNVAINSYDNALLTLLVSNQIVEIKGSVFKKFEKENLFQIACADIVERFQLWLMLSVIAFRNLIELSGSDYSSLPTSMSARAGRGHVWTILSPVLVVLGSECIVDWMKHAYITKFNHIRVSVYERFADVLCRDLVTAGTGGLPSGRKRVFSDPSPLVSRRLGFATLPLACLVIRVMMQALGMASRRSDDDPSSAAAALFDDAGASAFWHSDGVKWAGIVLGGTAGWVCLVAFKIILGINLLNFATRRCAGMEARLHEDEELNRLARSPLGEAEGEREYNKLVGKLVDHKADDLAPPNELGGGRRASANGSAAAVAVNKAPPVGGGGGKKKGFKLEEVTRWTMVKRIF